MLEEWVAESELDWTGSESCPMREFGISNVESSYSFSEELVT